LAGCGKFGIGTALADRSRRAMICIAMPCRASSLELARPSITQKVTQKYMHQFTPKLTQDQEPS
jgi:hypothetical protein